MRIVVATLGVVLFASSTARAQSFDITGSRAPRRDDPPPPAFVGAHFGAPGQIVLSTSATGASGSWSKDSKTDATTSSFGISPGFDYFVARNFALGLDVGAAHSNVKNYGTGGSLFQYTSTSLSAGLRLTINLPVSAAVSIAPRLTVGIESVRSEQSVLNAGTGTPPVTIPPQENTGGWITFTLPLLVHPTEHFFIGAGPRVFHSFAPKILYTGSGGDRTSLGADVVVGGWWGGESKEEAADEPAAPRFGQAGQIVLSNEIGSVRSLTYAGSDVESIDVQLSPGVDVFVVNHVSIGGAFAIGHSSSSYYASSGKVERSSTSFGGGPRVGVDIPIVDSLSFYPRIEGGYGTVTQTQDPDGLRRSYAYSYGILYAPVLVHPAPHFFAGFGPIVRYDSAGADISGNETHRTGVGASLILGGWI